MKKIDDIFSKKPLKKEVKEVFEIISDNREKNSLVIASLIELSSKITFENLEVGDYISGEYIVERKTFKDLLGSIINKRLFVQLENLKEIDKRILVIEGFDYNYSIHSIHENAIRGMLLSIIFDYKTPLFFTKNEYDTAKFLISLSRKSKKEGISSPLSKRASKKEMTLEERKKFILEGFPGIGPAISKRLLESNQNLEKIFSLSEEKLSEIEGLDKNKAKEFKKILRT